MVLKLLEEHHNSQNVNRLYQLWFQDYPYGWSFFVLVLYNRLHILLICLHKTRYNMCR